MKPDRLEKPGNLDSNSGNEVTRSSGTGRMKLEIDFFL